MKTQPDCKMTICFFYESAFSLGGIQRCITTLSNYLVRNGYDVTILCTNTKVPINRSTYGLDRRVKVLFAQPNTAINRVMYLWRKPLIFLNKKFGLFKNNSEILRKIYYPYYWDTERIFEKGDFDIIIGCSVYAMLISFYKNIKAIKIGWQHVTFNSCFESKKSFFYHQDALVNHMFCNLDEYIVLTEQDQLDLVTNLHRGSLVINNPISFKQPHKSELSNKNIIAVGRLDKVKGFDTLIKSFALFNKKCPDWTLNLVGEGPERKNLEEQICQLGLQDHIKLLGRRHDMPSLYSEASLFCLSSHAESWGLVLVEAMECGLPVISFNIPSAKIIAGDVGVLIPRSNIQKYADAMVDLATSQKKREYYAKKSIARAKDFYIERIGKEWEDLFYKLMSEKA